MNKKILFSPVGGTDPIKYQRDGSMLHICRLYRPDIVYLYLSQEMLEIHRKDNRYVESIEKLGTLLDHSFEIHVIEREGLVNVQQYDTFYHDFREEIRKIEEQMDADDELLLNMASGTPAMKSALLVIATLAEYRMLPIQVSTPQNRMNSELEDRENYDKQLNWEMNLDNESTISNRCAEVKCMNLMKLLKIEAIKKHVDAYDYSAALSVAKEIEGDLTEDAFQLLQIADARIKLNQSEISKLSAGKKYNIYPVTEGNKRKLFEYALVLQTKLIKKEYVDYIRGITPIVVELLENILKTECGIKLDEYCMKDKNGVLKWDSAKLSGAELQKIFDQAYGGQFRYGPVYSGHIEKIISYKCNDMVLKQAVEDIVKIENKARNTAAHNIVSVTEKWFSDVTAKTISESFDIIKYLLQKANINCKAEDWKSYDKMNEKIKYYLDQS